MLTIIIKLQLKMISMNINSKLIKTSVIMYVCDYYHLNELKLSELYPRIFTTKKVH